MTATRFRPVQIKFWVDETRAEFLIALAEDQDRTLSAVAYDLFDMALGAAATHIHNSMKESNNYDAPEDRPVQVGGEAAAYARGAEIPDDTIRTGGDSEEIPDIPPSLG